MENGVRSFSKATVLPRNKYDTVVAVIDEITNGSNDVIDILNSRISKVKSTPANGALNIPATAPAAPHPRRIVIFLYESPIALATFEPIAAPVYTIGASAPTDPPNPIVTELADTDDHILCGFILDSFFDTARSTLVTP